MKKPKYESWLMEGLLKPDKHYLPLDDDLGNLNDILTWAKTNDSLIGNFINKFIKEIKCMI